MTPRLTSSLVGFTFALGSGIGLYTRDASAEDYAELDVLEVYACPDTVVEGISQLQDSKQSLATVRDVRSGLRRTLRAGGSIAQYRVAYIGHNPKLSAPTVWLWSASGLCQQTLRGSPPPPAPKAAEPEQTPRHKRNSAPGPRATAEPTHTGLDERVSIVEGPNGERQLSREAVNDVLEHLPELQQAARVTPRRNGARQTGWQLALAKKSLLGRLGFEDGDELQAVNGVDLASPEGALRAYARVREQPVLKIQIERDGQPMTLTLRIVD